MTNVTGLNFEVHCEKDSRTR